MWREYKKFQVTIIFHLCQIYDRYKNTGYRDTHRLRYTGGRSLVSGHSDDHSINTGGTDAPTPTPPRSRAEISLPDYHSFLNYFEHTSEPTHFLTISSRLLGADCRGMLMRLVWHYKARFNATTAALAPPPSAALPTTNRVVGVLRSPQ